MRWIVSCAATIAATLLVSQAACASENFPRIVVVVTPLKPYVDMIIHGQGEVQSLLRPGQEPHDFSLTIPQGQMLDKADIIIVPDLGINPFLKRLLAKNTHAKVIELSKLDGANALPYDKTNPWLEAMKDAPAPSSNQQHWWRAPKPGLSPSQKGDAPAAQPRMWSTDGSKPTGKPLQPAADAMPEEKKDVPLVEVKKDEAPKIDPHLWIDPERMAAMAVPLATAIAQEYPPSRPELLANARDLTKHLRFEVIPAMREMLSKPSSSVNAVGQPQIPFLTYHAAYQYFLQSFHLTHHGEIMPLPNDKMGAATAAKMLNGAKDLHIHCIIGEQGNALTSRVATLTGARIVLLSPEQLVDRNNVDYHEWIRNDYDRFLYMTAKTFAGCL